MFPLLIWVLAAFGAYFAAGESLFEPAGIIAALFLGAFILWLNRFSKRLEWLGMLSALHEMPFSLPL